MKKKNLIILLLLPFLIALLIVQIGNRNLGPKIPRDISSIEWDYGDNEPFKLTDDVNGNLIKLKAEGFVPKGYSIDEGNELIWTVSNKDSSDETEYARIEQNDKGEYFLRILKEGFVTVTCTNAKGNVSRQMTACIYKKGLIMINPKIGSSQNNIDSTVYYGNKDIVDNKLVDATIDLDIQTIPSNLIDELEVVHSTTNFELNLKEQKIKLNSISSGKAYFTLQAKNEPEVLPSTFEFEIVPDGVNCYTYKDLLHCTNKSENGEIVVLRKSFESVENAYKHNDSGDLIIENGAPVLKANNVECFGTYNYKTDTYNFKNEAYHFPTTYNDNYIQQWNDFADRSGGRYKRITNELYVGLHVQKDFYGNGYKINMHNLTFPYETIDGTDIPEFRGDELFRGPLPFYTLGDPNNMALVSALGQDNIGMYVEGNNITVNDVDMKNCDFGNYRSNLDTTGTVIDIYGNDITIINSRFSSGRNVMRAFSSKNLDVINCALSYSRNFLFVSGSNEYIPIDGTTEKTFYRIDGTAFRDTIDNYLKSDINNQGEGDKILSNFVHSNVAPEDRAATKRILLALQDALNNKSIVANQYMGSSNIIDCMFYQSGICPIAAESLFNGPFLYNASPSYISEKFQSIGASLVPYTPTKVSGISYPVEINISGDTRFYDYKVVSDIDLSGLIDEHLTEIANEFNIYEGQLSIDNIFQLKPVLVDIANKNKYNFYDSKSGKAMANIAIAYYGGGVNLTKINYEKLNTVDKMQSSVDVGFIDSNLATTTNQTGLMGDFRHLMVKTVPVVTGYEPFRFNFYLDKGTLFGKAPSKADLMENAKKYKGEN